MPKPEPEEEEKKKERMDKKRKLKEMFDAEYDEGDATYFDDLKEEMHKQAQVQSANLTIYLAVCLQKYSTEFAPQRYFPGDTGDAQDLFQKVHTKKYMLVIFLCLNFLILLAGKESKQTSQTDESLI